MRAPVRTIRLPAGEEVPALGLGTWKMGEDRQRMDEEVAALRLGLELGMTLVDTAEMYAGGNAENVVREALGNQRNSVFLVSKVLPSNASRTAMTRACEASLRRLGTDRLDLYLLHWPGSVPLAETVAGFEALQAAGKIRHWGVSNFDAADVEDLAAIPDGSALQVNQLLYNLVSRGIEFDLLPAAKSNAPVVMAYSPLGHGDLARDIRLGRIATRHRATPAQIALAWVLRRPEIIAIPKAVRPDHVRDNRAALDIVLGPEDLAELDAAFPPPLRKLPLEMI